MPLKLRLPVIILLWLVAGLIPAVCSKLMLEYDGPHTEFYARLEFLLFAPLVLAHGLAWAIVPGHYNQWPAREFCELVASGVLCCVFIAHTWFTLTRKTLTPFVISSSAQAAILLFSAFCVLRYWDWDYHNMHG